MSLYLYNDSIHPRDFDGLPYLLRQYLRKDRDNPSFAMTCASSLFDECVLRTASAANNQQPIFNARREYRSAVTPALVSLYVANTTVRKVSRPPHSGPEYSERDFVIS